MGQATHVGCSFGTIHLCKSEEASGAVVLPSRCGATATGSHFSGKVSKTHTLDLAPDSWQLGSSSFGTVLRAVHRGSEEVRVARAIPKRRCDRELLLREVEVLKSLDHPNLARIHEVTEDVRVIWLILETAQGQDLLSAITSSCQSVSECLIAQLLRQLLLGLQHLHVAGLAHKAVQPRNILVSERPPGQELRLKLIDYGLASKFARAGQAPSALQCCHCLAPEQVSLAGSLSPRSLLAEPSCDLWAVGAIAFTLLSGQWPFEADSPELVQRKIRTGLWAFIPAELWAVGDSAKAFVSSLLVVHCDQRPGAAQALEHPFLRLDSLDKQSLQPLVQSQEVLRSLHRLSSRELLQHVVVNALATHLHADRLLELQRHLERLDPGRKGALTLPELRRGLVQAGVVLPGRLLGAFAALELDSSRIFRVEELTTAANERRRSLEELLLWAAWSQAAPEASTAGASQRRSEASKLLRQHGSALSHVYGTSVADLTAVLNGSSAEFVQFEELLRGVQEASLPRRGGGSEKWLFTDAADVDLALRLPSPAEVS